MWLNKLKDGDNNKRTIRLLTKFEERGPKKEDATVVSHDARRIDLHAGIGKFGGCQRIIL